MKKKLLLTGASGFLGQALCPLLTEQYTVVGTYFRHLPEEATVEWLRINLLETNRIAALVQQHQPDAILHLAAITNTTFCEEHPALSHHVNVYTTVALAEAAEKLQIPLLYTSTDLVFNGNSAPYSEEDFAYPISQYGQQKQMAEELLWNDFEHTIVLRLPLLFGNAPAYASNFFTKSVAQLQAGKQVIAFADEYRSMLSHVAASRGIVQALAYALQETPDWATKERLFHLGGSEGYSRYEFMQAVAKQLGVEPSLIESGLQEQAPYAHTRPADVRLDNRLAQEILGFVPSTLAEQLQEIL